MSYSFLFWFVIAPESAEQEQKRKNQIPAIAGVVVRSGRFTLRNVGKSLKHRKTLAEAIRFYRKEAKFTQEKLGELADLNPKYIGEVERCEKTISVDALARIGVALKVPLSDFFKETR